MPDLDGILPLLPHADPDWQTEFPPEHPANHRGILHRQDRDGACHPIENTRPAEPWTNTFATHPWMSRRNASELFGLKTDYPLISRSGVTAVPPGGYASWKWWNVYLSHPTLYCGKTLALLARLDDPDIDADTGSLAVRVTRRCWHCTTHGYSYRKCAAFGAKFTSKGNSKGPRIILLQTASERAQFLRYCFLKELIPMNRMRLVGRLLEVPKEVPNVTLPSNNERMDKVIPNGGPDWLLSSDDDSADEQAKGDNDPKPSNSQDDMRTDDPLLFINSPAEESPATQSPSLVASVGETLPCHTSCEPTHEQQSGEAFHAASSREASHLDVKSDVGNHSHRAQSVSTSATVERYEKIIALLMRRVGDLRQALQASAPALDSTDPVDQGLAVPDVWLDMAYQSRIVAKQSGDIVDIKPDVSRSLSKKRQLSEDSIELVIASGPSASFVITDGAEYPETQASSSVIQV